MQSVVRTALLSSLLYLNIGFAYGWKEDASDLPDRFKRLAIAMRVLFPLFFFSLVILISVRIAREFYFSKKGSNSSAPIRNLTKWVLCLLLFDALLNAFHNCWYKGPSWGFGSSKRPQNIYGSLGGLIDWIYLLMFTSILFHWVELYRVSAENLRRQEMMMKVNSRYKGDITVDEILTKVSFLRKLRIPYAFFVCLTFLIWILQVAFRFHIAVLIPPTHQSIFWICIVSYYAVVWTSFAIAFYWFGTRLMSIMPDALRARVRSITIQLMVVVLLCCFNSLQQVIFVSITTWGTKDPDVILRCNFTKDFLIKVVRLSVAIICLNIYLPFHKYAEWFRSWSSSTRTSTASAAISASAAHEDRASVELTAVGEAVI